MSEQPDFLELDKNPNSETPIETENSNVTTSNNSNKGVIVLAVVALTVAIVAAVVMNFVVFPKIDNTAAGKQLSNIVSARGDVTAVNTEMLTFTGQTVDNANVDQKALGRNGIISEPAGFIFNNGKNSDKKVVNFYGDFNNQRSRDFILMNREVLTTMIENGVIEFRFHPVPTGDTYSMYASEAVAESMITSPETSWQLIMELLKESATLDTDNSDVALEKVLTAVDKAGSKDIDGASIRNGTFVGWLLSLGNDPQLSDGFQLPTILIDGKEINQDEVNINNTDGFRKAVIDG